MKGKLLEDPRFYIYKIEFETGEIFNSVKEASAKYKGHISSALNGNRKTACGYHWKYIN